MAKRAQRIGVKLLSLLLLVGAIGLWRAGELRILTPHFAGSCQTLPMAASAADIRIDATRGLAYLAYLDTGSALAGKHSPGTIMLLDLNASAPHIRAALTADPPDFHPRALSLYAPSEAGKELFVVSGLRPRQYTIEIFQQTETGAYALVEVIRDSSLVSPSAILAVGPRQFYITDASGTAAGWARVAEFFAARGSSSLLYFDGQKLSAVATGLRAATGLAGSPDGRKLYVGEAGAKRLDVYDRDPGTGVLNAQEPHNLGSAPAEVNVDSRGNLWIAAHPKALRLLWHLHAAARIAPTQIFKVAAATDSPGSVTEVYLNRGDEISAGSVAAVYGTKMLVGALRQQRLLMCELPH